MKIFENYLAVKKISKCKEMFMPWNRIHFSLTEPGSGSIFPWRNQGPDPHQNEMYPKHCSKKLHNFDK